MSPETLMVMCLAPVEGRNISTNYTRVVSIDLCLAFLSFSSKSALVWNYLPDDLKSCTTIADFRVKLAVWLKDSLTLNHCCDLLSSNVHNQ